MPKRPAGEPILQAVYAQIQKCRRHTLKGLGGKRSLLMTKADATQKNELVCAKLCTKTSGARQAFLIFF